MIRMLQNILFLVTGRLLGRRPKEASPPTPGYQNMQQRGWRWWLARIAIALPALALAGLPSGSGLLIAAPLG